MKNILFIQIVLFFLLSMPTYAQSDSLKKKNMIIELSVGNYIINSSLYKPNSITNSLFIIRYNFWKQKQVNLELGFGMGIETSKYILNNSGTGYVYHPSISDPNIIASKTSALAKLSLIANYKLSKNIKKNSNEAIIIYCL